MVNFEVVILALGNLFLLFSPYTLFMLRMSEIMSEGNAMLSTSNIHYVFLSIL